MTNTNKNSNNIEKFIKKKKKNAKQAICIVYYTYEGTECFKKDIQSLASIIRSRPNV